MPADRYDPAKPGYLRVGPDGRALYECTRADRDGTLVGAVDTPELAAEIVAAVNRRRTRVRVATHHREAVPWSSNVGASAVAGLLFPKLVGKAMEAEAAAERARKLGTPDG